MEDACDAAGPSFEYSPSSVAVIDLWLDGDWDGCACVVPA